MEARLSPDTALYLYGIVALPIELPRCEAIEDGTSIDVIAGNRVACVVSPVPVRDYESSATGRTAAEQLSWVTPRAWRHHEIVRALHASSAVVPLKFGTVCGRVDDVRDMLARCAGPIGAMLDRFRGRDEWTLSIQIDAERVIERFERDDHELRALCEESRLLPEGRAYFSRKKRERRATGLLGAQLEATTREVLARIAPCVDALCEERTGTSAATLLVDRARFEDLKAALAGLETEASGDGLALELRGPWAPYSFVNGSVDCGELAPGSGIESRIDR